MSGTSRKQSSDHSAEAILDTRMLDTRMSDLDPEQPLPSGAQLIPLERLLDKVGLSEKVEDEEQSVHPTAHHSDIAECGICLDRYLSVLFILFIFIPNFSQMTSLHTTICTKSRLTNLSHRREKSLDTSTSSFQRPLGPPCFSSMQINRMASIRRKDFCGSKENVLARLD